MITTVGSRSRRSTPNWLCLLLIIIFLELASCYKNKDPPNYCPPSSCGEIHGITYPFRLDTHPPNCGFSSFVGDKNFTLSCHNDSSLFWYINNSRNPVGGRFLVKGINYDNFTIHLVDPGVQQGNCSSLPTSPISSFSMNYNLHYTDYTTSFWRSGTDGLFETYLSRAAVLISCDRKQVTNSTFQINDSYYSYFVEITAPCRSNSRKYSYVVLGWRYGSVPLNPEMESCSIDVITFVPLTGQNDNVTSYQEVHTQFSDGFHLSWLNIYCRLNCSDESCILDDANRPTCPHDGYGWKDYDVKAWFIYMAAVSEARSVTGYWVPLYKTWVVLVLGYLTNILAFFGAIHVVIFLFGSPCVFVFLIHQWKRRHLSMYNTIEDFLQNQNDLMPIRYSYKDIKKITSCFKEKLGEGGFGCLYKGKLRSGHFAAIKILGKSSKVTNGQDFMNEVATLGRIHHVNVVQLVGYCAEQSKRALVYDFMPNGSLDRYIFPKEGLVSLSWDKLFEISLGVARGIEYLHRGCDMQILHFDIKPHNILLDENFIPKVSDFGLAKLYPTTKDSIASFTAARGTIGYMAPELFYKNIGRVSYKADVYSFGMLLLEIAGKRKNLNALVEKSSQIYFPSWVYNQVVNGNDIEIVDNAMEGDIEIVKKMIIVGLWCIQMKPSNRPAMNKVVEMLEGDIENLEMPPKPSLYLEEMSNVAETSESSHVSDESSESISLIESTC